MLKGKMQKEMAKYQPIEGAFNQIKQNTSVKQA